MAETKRIAPGPLAVPAELKTASFALMFIGVVTFAVMLMKSPERAWFDYLAGYFYFFVLAIGGLFFTCVQHLTKAGWSVNVRRFCEAFAAYLPVAAVGFVGLLFGAHSLFEWF